MLVLSRKEGESIIIYPTPDIEPDMTVAELFKDGPVVLRLSDISRSQARISIEVSRDLQIARSELVPA